MNKQRWIYLSVTFWVISSLNLWRTLQVLILAHGIKLNDLGMNCAYIAAYWLWLSFKDPPIIINTKNIFLNPIPWPRGQMLRKPNKIPNDTFINHVFLGCSNSGSELKKTSYVDHCQTLHSYSLDLCIAVQIYKYLHLHLPVHLHLEVSLVAWPTELLLTHHLQTVSVHPW